ncbi:MAG: 8-amino-7-oxononanoate synthase [Vampirovibrionales bacterium]|nr:8-amino-7-oxononanoate synthase [Vampirovibrionales bacterium]
MASLRIETELETLRRSDRYRTLQSGDRVIDEMGAWICVNGVQLADFSSNDSLGLSQHKVLKRAAIDAIEQYGTGGASARLIAGSSRLSERLEETLAQWEGMPAARLFTSGYQLNVGLLSALAQPSDVFFLDRQCHASLIDGARVAATNRHVSFKRYRHLDMQDLTRCLEKTPCTGQRWIVTESLFSMSGGISDLSAVCDVADAFEGRVIVDEAHASGAYGLAHRWSGLVASQGVSDRVALQVGTAGKALGSHGAWVAGSQDLMDWLSNTCRSFIYTTALPPATLAATLAAIDLLKTQDTLPRQLHANIDYFWQLMAACPQGHPGLKPPPSPEARAHIIAVVLGDNASALKASDALQAAGCYIRAIRPPTVPEGEAMLRISLSAAHSKAQIERLCDVLLEMPALLLK